MFFPATDIMMGMSSQGIVRVQVQGYGKGVDGAVNKAGGAALMDARKRLPVVTGTRDTRCPVGEAVITIGGNLNILNNSQLASVDLSPLTSVTGQIDIKDNNALSRVDVFFHFQIETYELCQQTIRNPLTFYM